LRSSPSVVALVDVAGSHRKPVGTHSSPRMLDALLLVHAVTSSPPQPAIAPRGHAVPASRSTDEGTPSPSAFQLSKDAYNAISELARFSTGLRLDFGRSRPGRSDGYGLRLRPIVITPIPLPGEWKIVPRVRMPTWIALQDDGDDVRAGLSDIDSVVWIATPEFRSVQLGIGPSTTWPTAGNPAVGDAAWGVGASAAFVLTPGAFVAHVLATHEWTIPSGDRETEIEASARWTSRRGWAVGVTSESEIPSTNPVDSNVYLGPTIARVISTRVVHLQIELAVLGWVARDSETPSGAVELTTTLLLPDAWPPVQRTTGRSSRVGPVPVPPRGSRSRPVAARAAVSER
jgi:hypothetical protein